MSLILEALRKSEAERRRGQAPDLFAELPPAAHRHGRALAPWHWLLLAVAVCAALAWLTRDRWMTSTAPATAPVADTTVSAAPESSGETRVQPVEPDPIAATDNSANTSRITVDVVPIPPATAPRPAPSRPAIAPAPAVVQEPLPVEPEVAPPPAQDPVPTEPPQPVSSQAPEQATPATAPTPHNDALLELSDLTAEQRRQLPPLKLSMHLWNADPSRRFVIIDGARLGEGDRLGDAVIDRITTDSVILDWNGRRLRLSLR